MVVVLVLLAVLLAGYVVLCLFYHIFQERFIFVRFRMARKSRFRFRHAFEERWIEGADGAPLHALYFPCHRPRGVVLYLHGNTGGLRRWGKLAPRFTALGYDVLMPDPRGYGKSRGKIGEKALHDDAARWYRSLLDRWQEKDIVLYGRSLGSGLATPLAARFDPRMLLLETPFANLLDVARFYLPILPYRLLLKYRFRNDRAIVRVKCPVYVFHGQRDNIVPYHSALRLYALVPSHVERRMYTFPEGHHGDLYTFPRFKRAMRELLDVPATVPVP
ncbi:MAG: alpha/beta hydrolase [Flavobacteriales bacterium]|jgi:fermentation-respiration switch protein FrsA (DUF1100 family)|nr:alpha/beta hydrolase [Flavobacteriales bacterium]